MLSQNTSARAWLPWLLAISAFWFSSNLVLDCLVMPVMHLSGMTAQTDFAPAGYTLFWSYNRLELVCAAVILTGVLALRRRPQEFEVCQSGARCRWALAIGVGLLSLSLIDTYLLTPEMGAMAVSLNFLNEGTVIAPAMNWLHGTYWGAEVLKLLSLGWLARLCYLDLSDRLAANSANSSKAIA